MSDEPINRFPEMKPISSAPTLHTVNGIGMSAYGCRDFDPETNTYVKTVWFTVLFIPIVPLGSYRVADAPNGGWYFIGKVPVSGAAKGWTLLLVLAILGTIGGVLWNNHTDSASYKAGKKLDQAETLRKEGRVDEAAVLCREVAEASSDRRGDGMKAIAAMLDDPELLARGDAHKMAVVFRVAREVRNIAGFVPDLFARGVRFAEARSEDSPDGALEVLEIVEPDAPERAAVFPVKEKLLERMLRDKPDDVALLSGLAVVYAETNRRDRCLPLLEKHVGRLGTSEGARVLGLIYYEKGKHDEAFALLQPYADERLKTLQDAEQKYRNANKAAQDQILDQLRKETASDFNYAQFKTAPEEQRGQMLQDYLTRRLKENVELRRLKDAVDRQMVLVPVALDLGMMRMARAQRAADPAARKAELELAEKTFLAVRGVAGDGADYKIRLGQVYYWLGRQAEGRKLFDEIMEADGRKFESLMIVASILREMGATAEARTLLEEVYNKPSVDARQKQAAANLRALTWIDLDDEIVWLERADGSSPHVKASLAQCRGNKALRDGKEAEAAGFFRETMAIYTGLPEDSATLKNGAIAGLTLFSVTGDRAVLKQSLRMQEKALALAPGDGILVSNVAHTSLGVALGETIGGAIDLTKLRRSLSPSDLEFLFKDVDGRKNLVQALKANPAVTRARSHLDRALILAPNAVQNYRVRKDLLHFAGDTTGLAALERRAADSKFDLAVARKEQRDFLAGKDEEKYKRELQAGLGRADRTVAETRPMGGPTFAAAVAALVQIRQGQEVLGLDFDADELVKLAEEAHRVFPSSGTHMTLESALLARASKALVRVEPEYAALSARLRRALGSTHLVAVALWRDGKMRQAALANADVRRAITLVADRWARFPDEPTEWSWVMFRASQPELAASVAAAMATNESLRLVRSLESRLAPPDSASALRQCWALEAAGKANEARELLQSHAADGVPLP